MDDRAHKLFTKSKYATDIEFLHFKIFDWIMELEAMISTLEGTSSNDEHKSGRIKFRSTMKVVRRFMEEFRQLADGFCEERLLEIFMAAKRPRQQARRWTKQIFELEKEDIMEMQLSICARVIKLEKEFCEKGNPATERVNTKTELDNSAEWVEERVRQETEKRHKEGGYTVETVPADSLQDLRSQRQGLRRQHATLLELRDQIDASESAADGKARRPELLQTTLENLSVVIARLRASSIAFDKDGLTNALVEKRGMNRFMAEIAASSLVGKHQHTLSKAEATIQEVRKGIRRRVF